MKTFIFEQYGYYPVTFENNTFMVENWIFKLIEVDCDEEYIEKIDKYIVYMRKYFMTKGPFIVKTRSRNKMSVYDNKKYVLVSINKSLMSLKELNTFHVLFKDDSKNVNLRDLFATWKERMEYIELEATNSLRIDSVHYKSNIEATMFCLGMAQNAIQYLSEIILDYDDTIDHVTITHKRLADLESFEFLNPFNMVMDHPLRDLVELYKNNLIQFEDLLELFKYYEFDNKLASVFIARMMYPAEIFDLLEENIAKKSTSFRLNYNVENELLKIKKIYLCLREKFAIRPIVWLEN